MKLPPYPDYKPSNVEWLGEVPAHWNLVRIKGYVSNVIDQTNEFSPEKETYIALANVENWTGRLRNVATNVEFDSQVKRFLAGDVLFGKLRPYLAKVTRPSRSGVCVGEFLVLRPRNGDLLATYLEQILRSKPVIDAIDASTYGAKMPRTSWQCIGHMYQALPSLAEQKAIVRYLDHADRRIQRYLSAKQRLISLLEEQRQAVIHRAVTRGLDPKVPLKPSGVEWLGDVPAHWEVQRLKNCSRLIMGQSPSSDDCNLDQYENDPPFLQGCAEFGIYNPNPVQYCRTPPKIAPGRSVLMSVRAPVGRFNMADQDYGIGRGLCAIIPNGTVLLQHFAWYQLPVIARGLRTASTGSTYDAVSMGDVGIQKLFLPTPDEQTAIVEYLDKATADIDTAIDRTRREIELLSEYRTRLVSDVVTGKLDVRRAAANLPHKPGKPVKDETGALCGAGTENSMMDD